MSTPTPERVYRAACPGCGADIDFLSAQATHAICTYCQSMVVRNGQTLSRIGKMAELFDDHSPLALQVTGTWQGQAFTLIGQLQYQYGEGSWTEWHALLADGSSAFLSEDNGAYVMSQALEGQHQLPAAQALVVGYTQPLGDKAFTVTFNQQISLRAAKGELPRLPALGKKFAMVELRSQDGEVLSLDYNTSPPTVFRGVAVQLEDLKPVGLRDSSTKTEVGQQFNCPQCGAAITKQLDTTKSLTCGSCNSIIDLSQGIGGALKYAQQEGAVPLAIALGSTGTLQGVKWQVVGFQRRTGCDSEDESESFEWDEYLLYNAKRGFIFLVDSMDGWSVVRPTTGAPALFSGDQRASYLGSNYKLKERYTATTDFVLGEFYWQVRRGQVTQNSDYANGDTVLNKEQSQQEVTWSVGSKIDADLVANAFALNATDSENTHTDVAPVSGRSVTFWIVLLIVVFFVLPLVLALRGCPSCDPATQNCTSSSSRTSGGSYGGSSGGGGHK